MFPLPLTVTLNPSRQLRWVLLALHGLALIATWSAQLHAPLQIALSLLLTASAIWHGQRRVEPIRLRCGKDGQISLHANGDWHPMDPASPPVLWPSLIILQMRLPHRKRPSPLLVLPDSLPGDDFRRLRVWLQWRFKSGRKDSGVTASP